MHRATHVEVFGHIILLDEPLDVAEQLVCIRVDGIVLLASYER